MKFISLKDSNLSVSFEQALFDGIAPGGGLYFPTYIPQISNSEIKRYAELSFPEVANEVLSKWLLDDIEPDDLKQICDRAFNFELPIVQVGEYKVLELFHGPTMAFKDVAARFLAQTMQYYLANNGKTLNLAVATSGDTGGAIASAFGGLANVNVFILFPKDRVSVMQRQQLTQVEDNVVPFEIDGSFDDCQALVKTILDDKSLALPFSTANSINIGRLLPQISYYVYARARLGEYATVVPTGNLGNATAALLAHKMGTGPSHITLACNANDTLAKFAQNKKYTSQPSVATLSNAMDVGDPNNFTRYFAALGGTNDNFDELTDVISVSDKETIESIKRVYEKYDYLLDPHTAVAWHAAEISSKKMQKLIVSTAAPIKFAAEIENATGIKVKKSSQSENSSSRVDKSQLVGNDYEQVKKIIVLHAKK